jgi:OOP family OmpA-OmpF porin
LLFAPDGTTLRSGDASAALALTAAAQLLKRRPRLSAQVDVYTDNIGGESLNRALSEQRAEEVAAALRAAGVAARRLQAHGGGLQDALASNDTAQGRMENRRLEIVFEYAQLGDASKGSAPAASAPLEAAPPLSPGRATAPAGG